MTTHRPLPFATKDSERKKGLEGTSKQLTASTFTYFEVKGMNPAQLAQAQRVAREWKAKGE